jgi:DNA-binding NtrC family response regulator
MPVDGSCDSGNLIAREGPFASLGRGAYYTLEEVFSMMTRQVAPTMAPVRISGESGNGKELAARAIHTMSSRSSGPFLGVHCAALPESLMEDELLGQGRGSFTGAVERRAGCFRQVQKWTLLRDEIRDMPISTQDQLLRVIEGKR